MPGIIIAAGAFVILRGVVGSVEGVAGGSSSSGDDDSLIISLKNLRHREQGLWIDEALYNRMEKDARELIESVRMNDCETVSLDAPLLDSFNDCFGKPQRESIRGKAEFLLVRSCRLARGEGTSPPASPASKVKKFFQAIKSLGNDDVSDSFLSGSGNKELLHRLIAEGLVRIYHDDRNLLDVCMVPEGRKVPAPSFQCPTSYERPVIPDWDAEGFWSDSSDETTKSTVKAIYETLLNRDCILHKGTEQFLTDTKRIQFRASLLDVIKFENRDKAPAKPTSTAEKPANVGRFLADIMIAENTPSDIETEPEHLQKQYRSEIRQLYDTCTNAMIIYSFIARGSESAMNKFFDGRPMHGALSGQKWRKFNYPSRTDRVPFHYYQGISDVCLYVMFFERKPAPPDSPMGTLATYPTPHEMFNVIATVVENVHDIPLGALSEVVDRFQKHQAEGIFGAINTGLGINKSLVTDADMMAPIGGFLNNIIIRSFIDTDAALNMKPVSETDPTPRLKKVWSFVFKHGHYGLIAFIAAAYKTIAPYYATAPDILKQLQSTLNALNHGNLFDEAIKEAQTILSMRIKWRDDSDVRQSFPEIIDDIEMEAILQVRPPVSSNSHN